MRIVANLAAARNSAVVKCSLPRVHVRLGRVEQQRQSPAPGVVVPVRPARFDSDEQELIAVLQMNLPYRDADTMRNYEAKGRTVRLTAGQKEKLELPIISSTEQ